ncbi:MAG: hypothetical protein IT173_05525 [Acidobacteria bacterium]|nr:hypothetical protein [Acidobacteriota bacterium]
MERSIDIRECTTLEQLAACVGLQREVFKLPEVELSPVRHLVVTRNAGGFILGAFSDDELVGFVLSVPAFLRGEKAFYSHMTAVRDDFQSYGVGARLKWSQRTKALELGVQYVKWTFEPWKARNAYFNLEKLGVEIREYEPNFYGVDVTTAGEGDDAVGLFSDRLFAEWDLAGDKVRALAAGEKFTERSAPRAAIETPPDWAALVAEDPRKAFDAQKRLRAEFETAFESGLVARGFLRDEARPMYLMY